MAHLIDKAALVAEIERRRKLVSDHILSGDDLMIGERNAYFNLLLFINTLEVKEVDLEHEVESYWKQCDMTWCRDAYSMTHIRSMLSEIAKHFFELGLKAKNPLTWKDIQQLILIAEKLKTDVHFEAVRLRTDLYLNNKNMTEEMFYTEVLKRFKESMRKQ